MLRMRNYRVVLIPPPNSHQDLVSISQASVHLDFFSSSFFGIDGGFTNGKSFFPDPSTIWLPSIVNSRPESFNVQTSSRSGQNLTTLKSDPVSYRTPPLARSSYHDKSGVDVFHDLPSAPSRKTGASRPGDGLFPRPRSTTLELSGSSTTLRQTGIPPVLEPIPFEKHLEPLSPLESKGKERDPPVVESDNLSPRGEVQNNNSYSTTKLKVVDPHITGSPQPYKPLFASSFPKDGVSRRSTASSSSMFSIIQQPDVSTVQTSAEKKPKSDKNVPDAIWDSPKNLASPSVNKKIQTEDTVIEQKDITALPPLGHSKPALPATPKPVMSKTTSEFKSAVAPIKPSDSAVGQSPALGIKGWVPLITLLRVNGTKLPFDTLPAKLLKSCPHAYEKVGQKKYSKYIQLAAESKVVKLLRESDGQLHVHLDDKYTKLSL